VPDGTSLVPSYRSTDDPSGVAFPTGFLAEKSLVAPRRALAVRLSLSGDGRKTPRAPLSGVALETRPFDAQLLRADRSELPGGSLLKGLGTYFARAGYAISEVGGRVRAHAVTDRIGRVPPFGVQVFTEAAIRLLMERWLEEEWSLEGPTLGGTGLVLRVRGTGLIDVREASASDVVVTSRGVERHVLGVAEGIGVEVLEVAPLGTLLASGGSP
jgi:hypothetical protein